MNELNDLPMNDRTSEVTNDVGRNTHNLKHNVNKDCKQTRSTADFVFVIQIVDKLFVCREMEPSKDANMYLYSNFSCSPAMVKFERIKREEKVPEHIRRILQLQFDSHRKFFAQLNKSI